MQLENDGQYQLTVSKGQFAFTKIFTETDYKALTTDGLVIHVAELFANLQERIELQNKKESTQYE